MRVRLTVALVGSILCVGLGSRARAGDPPVEDAPSMLRRARVAETVDHDIPKAMDLYRKVFAAAGDTDTSRDAALHLMDLLEARGDRPGALGFAKELSDRFTARLDDAMKRQVHETMARTLPAGSHAKSPLGDVYVLPAPGSASNPSPSPLETKILAILSRLDSVEEANRGATENDVMRALLPVGTDALPILERVLYDARPERARFAAQTLARVGKAAAIPTLIKAVREGDGFTRASAIGGLALIDPSPGVSPQFVGAVEQLFALPALVDRLPLLASALAPHLSTKECLDRFAQGGPPALTWLYAAQGKDPVETADRITKLSELDPAVASRVAEIAGRIGGAEWSGSLALWTPRVPGLPLVTRVALLDAIVRMKASAESEAAAPTIAKAIDVSGSPEQQAAAASKAWAHALDAETPALRLTGVDALATYGISPTISLLENSSRSTVFGEVVGALLGGKTFLRDAHGTVRMLFRKELFGVPALWMAIERLAASAATSSTMLNALNTIGQSLGETLPPPSEDVRWLGIVVRSPQLNVSWIRRAAGRLGDPRLLDVARSEVLGANDLHPSVGWTQDLIATYRGPGRGAFALDLHAKWGAQNWGLLMWARDDAELWPLIAKRLGTYSIDQRKTLFYVLNSVPSDQLNLPLELDAEWIAELRRPTTSGFPIVEPIVSAAARSNSPEYVTVLRELVADAGKEPSAYLLPMIRHLKEYARTDGLAVLVELLTDPKSEDLLRRHAAIVVQDALVASADVAAVAAALDRIARDPAAPGNDWALSVLLRPERREDLVALFRTMEKPGTPMREPYRAALVAQAQRLRLKEAIPFLLKEYREGREFAAVALDEIRTFYDRIKAFEGAVDGQTPLAAEVDADAVTKGPTVELRRAAVFALAATHGAKAVPSLLEIARTTSDEPVRAAAIEMIEKFARGTTVTAPPPVTPAKVDPTPAK